MAYDFRRLSPYDFEGLVRDLLSAELRFRLESFTVGVDGGIDLRHVYPDGSHDLIQCKQYANSTVSQLLADMRRHEVSKVQNLAPRRYGIATALGLTPANKTNILRAFSPFIPGPWFIWGKDDLDALLTRHPDVTRRHFKLWLASTEMLDAVVHAEVLNRTDGYLMRVSEEAPLYVETAAYSSARKILRRHHICIISGMPGIGKSALANMLLLHHVKAGFQPVVVSTDISQGWEMRRPDAPQFFLYDDFLGANTLDRMEKNEDGRLLDFMRLVERTRNKRLVMCTREYILREATLRSERWRFEDIDLFKFVLTLKHYSRFQRARILYNHLFFSHLSQTAVHTLVEDKKYLAIIDHPNYNPRLVNHLVMMARKNAADNQQFAAFAISNLENPERLWLHAYETDLDRTARALLLALVSMPDRVSLSRLIRAAAGVIPGTIKEGDSVGLNNVLRRLEGTFIDLVGSPPYTEVSFHDPSIRDFLLGYLAKHPEDLARVLDAAISFIQVQRILEFAGLRTERIMAPKSSHAPLAQAVNVVHDAVLNALKRTAMVREIEYGDMTRYGASYERRLLLTLREFVRYGHDDSTWTTRACSFLEEIWSKGDLDLQSIRDFSRQVFTLPASVNEWFSRQLRHLKSALLMSGDSAYDFDALVEIFNDDGLALAEIRERLLEYIDSNEYSSELHDAAHVALEVAQTLGLDHDNPYVLFLEHIASSSDRGEDELDTSNVDEQTESEDSNDPSDLAIDKLFQTLRDPRA